MAEDDKTEQAQDIAYTINHAISCGTNDILIAPTISALFGVQVGCSDPSHDHDHHHAHEHHGHDHHPHEHRHAPVTKKFNWKIYRSEALHYLRGEIVGDVLAVPLTIGVQRMFPSFMDGIRHVIEPVTAPFFRKGANTAAKRWGEQQGLSSDAPEIVAHAQALYQREMKHLPQAVMWNVFAFPIGVVTQKMGGHTTSYGRIIRNKSIGSVISNTILLGGRALAPNVAQAWDATNAKYVIKPLNTWIGNVIGIEPKWSARVADAKDGWQR